MTQPLVYAIRDLEEITGIPAQTIRTWERRYGIFAPQRTPQNERRYSRHDLELLQQIALLHNEGMRISRIAGMSPAERETRLARLSPIAQDGDFNMAICLALQQYDADKILCIIDCLVRREGFDLTLINYLEPFLRQTAWHLLSGALQPVHERIFSSVLQRKCQSEIEKLSVSPSSPCWVVVPAEETQISVYPDILEYFLLKAGKRVIQIPRVADGELSTALSVIQPEGVCVCTENEAIPAWLPGTLSGLRIEQGNTLVFTPGKTLEIVNDSQNGRITALTGVSSAFQHVLSPHVGVNADTEN